MTCNSEGLRGYQLDHRGDRVVLVQWRQTDEHIAARICSDLCFLTVLSLFSSRIDCASPRIICDCHIPIASQDQINSRIDLVLRMSDEKWRLAQHAYDRLDVNIRRLDADLGRMEVRARCQRAWYERWIPVRARATP